MKGGVCEFDCWCIEEVDLFCDGSLFFFFNLLKGKVLFCEMCCIQNVFEFLGCVFEGIIGCKNFMFFSVGFGDIDQIGVWMLDLCFYLLMKELLNMGNVVVYSIDFVGS